MSELVLCTGHPLWYPQRREAGVATECPVYSHNTLLVLLGVSQDPIPPKVLVMVSHPQYSAYDKKQQQNSLRLTDGRTGDEVALGRR